MKRTALVAIMVMALVLGVAAYATAQTENVDVTARINPMFSMTLDSHNFDYGALDIGSLETTQGPVITIKSNKTYTFNTEATTVSSALNDAPSLTEMLARQYEVQNVTNGPVGARGVTVMDYDYYLDLTGDGAYDILPDDYTFTYGYTAVQN